MRSREFSIFMERYDILENFGQLSIDRYRFMLLKYYIVDSTNIYYKLWWAWKGETNNCLSPWKNIAYYTISIKRRQIFIALRSKRKAYTEPYSELQLIKSKVQNLF